MHSVCCKNFEDLLFFMDDELPAKTAKIKSLKNYFKLETISGRLYYVLLNSLMQSHIAIPILKCIHTCTCVHTHMPAHTYIHTITDTDAHRHIPYLCK